MTISRQYRDRTITFECDQCGDEFPTDSDDFQAALAEAKDACWRPVCEGGEWLHLCPDCHL